MKRFTFLYFILLCTNAFSQTSTFEKCYQPLYTSGFNSITHDSVGDFYVVGSSGRAFAPCSFVKLDRNGNFLLENYFYFSDINYLRKIIPTPDGNFVAIGNASGCDFGGSFGVLAKISPSGNVLWAKSINSLEMGVPGNNTPNNCLALHNGNILVTTDTITNFFNEFGDSLYTTSTAVRRFSHTNGLANKIVCLDQSGIVILDSTGQQINYIPFTVPFASINLLPDSTYLCNSGNLLIKVDTSFNIITQVDLTTLNLTLGPINIEPGKIWIGNFATLNYTSFDYNLQLIDSFTARPNGVGLSSYSVYDTSLIVAGTEGDRNYHSYLKLYSTSGNYTSYNTDLSLINISFDTTLVTHPNSLPSGVYSLKFVARLTVQNTGIDTIHSFYVNTESLLSGPCGNFPSTILVDSLELAPGQTTSLSIDTLGEYGIVISNFPFAYQFCAWVSCPNFKVDQDHSNNYQCDSAIFIGTTSISDANSSDIINIYPNPFDSKVTIKIFYEKYQNSKFNIYNAMGENKLSGVIKEEETSLDLSELPSGIYIIVVSSNGITTKSKIIKS